MNVVVPVVGFAWLMVDALVNGLVDVDAVGVLVVVVGFAWFRFWLIAWPLCLISLMWSGGL